MAYTSIIPVSRLDNSITYIRNKDKTTKKGQSAGSLEEAICALEADPLILDTLGEHVAANYIAGKKKEWDEYRTRVSSWEREKYIINY